MDIAKTVSSEGRLYGVVYDPTDHKVTLCYRGIDNEVVKSDGMTDTQLIAMKTFAAAFIPQDGTEKIEDVISAEIQAKKEAEKVVEETPIEK